MKNKRLKLIKEKSLELLDYAKEKGTPVLERAASNVRNRAIDVTRDVLKKLEEKEEK